MGKTSQLHYRSAVSHPSLLHSQDPFSAVKQSSFQNRYHALLFVFWWTKSWHHWSTLRKRLNGWSWLIKGQLFVTCLLFTVWELLSTARQSSFQNNFHTLLFLFWWTKSDSIPDQDWGRDFMGEADSIAGQLLVTHLWYKVQDLFSTAIQYSFQNSFCTLLSVF